MSAAFMLLSHGNNIFHTSVAQQHNIFLSHCKIDVIIIKNKQTTRNLQLDSVSVETYSFMTTNHISRWSVLIKDIDICMAILFHAVIDIT